MITIDKLYCGSRKEAAIFLATLILFCLFLNLIFMDFTTNSYLLDDRDLKDDRDRTVVFYSGMTVARPTLEEAPTSFI